MGSFSIWHWLIVLIIATLIFGTKRLRNIGEDVGGAVKSFRKAMQSDDKPVASVEAHPTLLDKKVYFGVDAEATEQRDPQRQTS